MYLNCQCHKVKLSMTLVGCHQESHRACPPGQAPVVAMDQPLFTIAKNIQWKWPSVYGESKFVIMFGRLHIELAALKTAGNLLESSGWTGALDCRQVLPHLGKQTRF